MYNPIAFIASSLNFYFKHEIQLTKALSELLWRDYLQSAMFVENFGTKIIKTMNNFSCYTKYKLL